MKSLIIIPALFFSLWAFSQDEILRLAFQDKSNFDITILLENKRPDRFFVLATTDKWNSYRFHLDEKEMNDRREHSPYMHSYVFKDTMLNRIISDSEKLYLSEITKTFKPRVLTGNFSEFTLIKSFSDIRKGFFFSVTDPAFTKDRQYAFIDIVIFKKDDETKVMDDCYFGHTLLIFQNQGDKGWTRIKKVNYLIL
jgi:hypothetical protein